MKKLVYILLCVCVLAACEDGEVSTNYVVTPYVQFVDKGHQMPEPDVRAYGYYGDTTQWRVASYDDALIGLLTSRSDETVTKLPDFTADPDAEGKLTLGPFTRYEFMVLMCQTNPEAVDDVKMYAWRNAATVEDLPQLSVHVTFKPWRTTRYKSEGKWLYVNEMPPAEPEGPDPEP